MKLIKIELNEGIKLSKVKNKTWIYEKKSDYIETYCYSEDLREIDFSDDQEYCILENNKVINIIQDEEYNNDKPYLIKKENIIVGFIEREHCDYSGYLTPVVEIYSDGTINDLILNLNKKGLEVYKQE